MVLGIFKKIGESLRSTAKKIVTTIESGVKKMSQTSGQKTTTSQTQTTTSQTQPKTSQTQPKSTNQTTYKQAIPSTSTQTQISTRGGGSGGGKQITELIDPRKKLEEFFEGKKTKSINISQPTTPQSRPVHVSYFAEIPKEERIIKERPSPVGYIFSPFETYTKEKYSTPYYFQVVGRSPVPSGKGTMVTNITTTPQGAALRDIALEKSKAEDIQRNFLISYEKELQKARIKDIAFTTAASFAIGFGAGSLITRAGSLIPSTIARTSSGIGFVTKSQVGAVVGGTILTYSVGKNIQNIAEEYKELSKLDKSLAKSGLAINIAKSVSELAAGGIGYAVGAKRAAYTIAKTEKITEKGIFVGKELNKNVLIGKGYSIQKVEYEVPLFGKTFKKNIIREIEYPFLLGTVKKGKGAGLFLVSGKSQGFETIPDFSILKPVRYYGQTLYVGKGKFGDVISFGIGTIGTKGKGMVIFGKPTIRIYEPFKDSFTLAKEIKGIKLKTPYELFDFVGGRKVGIFKERKEIGGMQEYLGKMNIKLLSKDYSIKIKTPIRGLYQFSYDLKNIEKYSVEKIGFVFPEEKTMKIRMPIKSYRLTSNKKMLKTIQKQQLTGRIVQTPKIELKQPSLAYPLRVSQITSEKRIQIQTPQIKMSQQRFVPSLLKNIEKQSIQSIAITREFAGVRTIQRIIPAQSSIERSIQRSISIPRTVSITQPIITPQISIPTPRTPRIPIMPMIPLPFLQPPKISFELFRGYQKDFLRGRTYKYQPSFSALILNIKSPKIPKTTITGVTLRPIIKKTKSKK